MTNFEKSVAFVLKSEGGYSSDVKDPGNWTAGRPGLGLLKGTKYGISASSFPELDIKNLTESEASAIYKKQYWDKIQGEHLLWPLCYLLFDFAVNSGVTKASTVLQSCLGVTPDGIIGPITVSKANSIDQEQLCKDFCKRRYDFLSNLKTWSTYKNGWTSRMNDAADNAGLDWRCP